MIIDTPKGPVEFPDDMPQEEIQKAVASMMAPEGGRSDPAVQEAMAALQEAEIDPSAGGRGRGGQVSSAAAQAPSQRNAFSGRRQATTAPRPDVPVYEQQREGTIMGPLTQGITMGSGDELMGIGAMFSNFVQQLGGGGLPDSEITGETGSETMYKTVRDEARADIEDYSAANPKTAQLAELGGAMLTGGSGGARVLAKEGAKQIPASLAKISALSGGQGAAYGWGTGEGARDSLIRAGTQGLTSAVAGPLMTKAGQFLFKQGARPIANKAYKKAGPPKTINDLKQESQAFYKKLEESNVRVKPSTYKKFKDQLVENVDNEGVAGPVRTQLNPALREIAALKNPSFRDLQKAQTKLNAAKRSSDGGARTYAHQIGNEIDDLMKGLKFSDVQKGSKLKDFSGNLTSAKDLWQRKAKAETLESIMEVAEDSAAAQAGKLDQAVSAAIRPVLRSQNRRLGMGETIGDLRDIVRGGSGKGVERGLAKVAPGAGSARGLESSLGAGALGYAATGSPKGILAGLAPGAIGLISQKILNKMTIKEFEAVQHAVLNKGRDSAKQLLDKMVNKYGGQIAGASSGAVASGAETTGTATEIQQMMEGLTK